MHKSEREMLKQLDYEVRMKFKKLDRAEALWLIGMLKESDGPSEEEKKYMDHLGRVLGNGNGFLYNEAKWSYSKLKQYMNIE